MTWKIANVELRRIEMPLVSPFRTSFGSQTERDILLVRVDLADASGGSADTVEGWGECVALSEPSYSPEYVDGAQHVIIHHLLPRLMAAGPLGFEGQKNWGGIREVTDWLWGLFQGSLKLY